MTQVKPRTTFALNRLNMLIIRREFTLAMIVDELLTIEAAEGYEFAQQIAWRLNYEALTDLAKRGDEGNDPNQVPTRFFILPGADDTLLEQNDCLDEFPYPIHSDAPNVLSVALLEQMLELHNAPALEFAAPEQAFFPDRASVNEQRSQFSEQLEQEFVEYLKQRAKPPQENTAKSYTVKAGDTLSRIAHQHGLSNWQLLWKANKEEIPNPDLIYPKQKLIIPTLTQSPMANWIKEQKEDPQHWQNGLCYRFPADYLSLSVVTAAEEPWQFEQARLFDVYICESQAPLLYQLPIEEYDQVSLLLPDRDDLGWGLHQDTFCMPNKLCIDREQWLTAEACIAETAQAQQEYDPPKPNFPPYNYELDAQE